MYAEQLLIFWDYSFMLCSGFLAPNIRTLVYKHEGGTLQVIGGAKYVLSKFKILLKAVSTEFITVPAK